jgi:hypothetical protein
MAQSSKPKNFMDIPREKRQQKNNKAFFPPHVKAAKIPEDAKYYTVLGSHKKHNSKFGITNHVSRFIFRIPEGGDEFVAEEKFKEVIENLIDDAYKNTETKEGMEIYKFLVEMHCEAWYDPVVIPARTKEENTVDVIYNAVMKLQQSFKNINILHEPISCIVTTLQIPSQMIK